MLTATSAPAQTIVQYYAVQSGTGFFVNRDFIVTNEHVVEGCSRVDISGPLTLEGAEVVLTDKERDLALIKSSVTPQEFAPLRMDIDGMKPDDGVVLFGYPGESGMHGQYTFAKAKVEKMEFDTIGSPWQFYISDVLQHGNSGGPVLDMSGNVIGVAVGRMQLKTMDMATNQQIGERRLGVVISLRALRDFLESHGIFVQWGSSGLLTLGDSTLMDNAKNFIVNVQCRMKTDGPGNGATPEGQP